MEAPAMEIMNNSNMSRRFLSYIMDKVSEEVDNSLWAVSSNE
jgi:hypothetical protein